ncbi:MAG: hypothetical protein NE328_10655 [Lentisphaeraceae bacterium]|nr:hypothetical protein [Lentisphaeraceae bacterium]
MKTSRLALYSLALSLSAFMSIPALDFAINYYVGNFSTQGGIVMGYSPEIYYTMIFKVSAMFIGGLSSMTCLTFTLLFIGKKLEESGQVKTDC